MLFCFCCYFIPATVAAPLDQLQSPLSSDMEGNPYLYITERDGTTYVNNAKIIKSKSGQEFVNLKGGKQVNFVKYIYECV